MSNNYASILASKYHEHNDTSLQGDVELAFTVVEILSEARNLTEPWSKLLDIARGLIKTRAKRSRTRFKMQFKKAVDDSDLTPITELPGLDLPKDREDRFRLRILNPRFMSRRDTSVVTKVEIAPKQEHAIITEEKLFTKEREDEFRRRVNDPRSFRRRD